MPREHEDLRPLIAAMEPIAPGTLVVSKKVAMQIVNVDTVTTFNKRYPSLARKSDIDKLDLARAIITRRQVQERLYASRGPKKSSN